MAPAPIQAPTAPTAPDGTARYAVQELLAREVPNSERDGPTAPGGAARDAPTAPDGTARDVPTAPERGT